jgi:hypothetical protein
MLSEQQQGKPISNKLEPEANSCQPMIYQMRVKGHLGSDWTDWFEGWTITQEENGDTLLTGPLADQAALHGLLKKVRDLGMPLISVNCLEFSTSTSLRTGQADAGDGE